LHAQTKSDEKATIDKFKLLGIDKRVKRPRALQMLELRWKHLGPVLGHKKAANLSTDAIVAYRLQRQDEGASNASINREMSALKQMFTLGMKSTPPKVKSFPWIKKLTESEARQDWVDDTQYDRLVAGAKELYLRCALEIGFEWGWRRSEMLGLRVNQINFRTGKIRLPPGTTKNGRGRECVLTPKLKVLLLAAVAGKRPDHFVLTRAGQPPDRPVSDFRRTWANLCVGAGVGSWVCNACSEPVEGTRCECGGKRKYKGLHVHGLRRSAAKCARAAGVPEGVICTNAGWLSRAVFDRYCFTDTTDQAAYIKVREDARKRNRAAASGPFSAPSESSQEPSVQ
jgi:integrase